MNRATSIRPTDIWGSGKWRKGKNFSWQREREEKLERRGKKENLYFLLV